MNLPEAFPSLSRDALFHPVSPMSDPHHTYPLFHVSYVEHSNSGKKLNIASSQLAYQPLEKTWYSEHVWILR